MVCLFLSVPCSTCGQPRVTYSVEQSELPWELARIPSLTSLKLGGYEAVLCIELCPPPKDVAVLTPSICECDVIWKSGLWR